MGKKKAKKFWRSASHKQIYLRSRGHRVDIHVYPALYALWTAGIQTFYSCQGGPSAISVDNSIDSTRAYVVVLKKDVEVTLDILSSLKLDPVKDKMKKRIHKDQIAIRFNPSEEAQLANIKLIAE